MARDKRKEGAAEPVKALSGLYAADPTASTPLLSALAEARGISLPDLVERVLAKGRRLCRGVRFNYRLASGTGRSA